MTLSFEQLDKDQRCSVELIESWRCGIVTGGPGTGKTSCLSVALERLDTAGKQYLLAAPTGKAARRMTEATGRSASTIHRLLGWRGEWTHHAGNPLRASAVIVDEASMIDIELFAALLDAIDPNITRLILIGDADQLPPVGPGRPFGDMVDHQICSVIRLKTLHRSAAESWIHHNAPRVLAGDEPTLDAQHDFMFCDVPSAVDILPKVRWLATEFFPKRVQADYQILIPNKKGVAGTVAANAELQAAINPPTGQCELKRVSGEILRQGDRVIHTRNDYDLGVFNGEVGAILAITPSQVLVELEGRAEPITYTLEQSQSLQLAYALTVHKSQGSEFPWVAVVCHSTHTISLTRQLLYTAITRGKKGVVLVGDKLGLQRALANNKPALRLTTLWERLCESLYE